MQPVMIVTGASQGIGAAVARLAGRRGWRVALTYRGNRAMAEAVVADIAAAGGQGLAGCGKSSKFEGFPEVLRTPPCVRGVILPHPSALTTRIVPSGPLRTESWPRYAAAPSSFGIRTRL